MAIHEFPATMKERLREYFHHTRCATSRTAHRSAARANPHERHISNRPKTKGCYTLDTPLTPRVRRDMVLPQSHHSLMQMMSPALLDEAALMSWVMCTAKWLERVSFLNNTEQSFLVQVGLALASLPLGLYPWRAHSSRVPVHNE
jgi:hypothetical protein